MAVKYFIKNIPYELKRDACSFFNKKLNRRPSSSPFISGDSYRTLADFLFDETHLCSANEINNFSLKRKPVIFLSSWLLKKFTTEVLPEIKIKFVLITHQGDKNITNTEPYLTLAKSKYLFHWFAQNCLYKNAKITPLPIGLEDRWRHNAGDIKDFKSKKLKNNKKETKILFGFSLNTNPKKRVPCYLALSGKKNTSEIFRSPNAHLYRKLLSQNKFIASPEGNGLDCHRTWEAIYLNVVPIVIKNYMTETFASMGLPLFLINDWSEVSKLSENELNEIYETLWKTADLSCIQFDYWRIKIQMTCK